MKKIRITPLSPTGETPVDFYSWGDHYESGLISRRSQVEEQLQDAFDSIEIKEDEETPELDYILKVLGKEAGRVVIPFDMVVKDAYYDKDTKEIVLVIQVGHGEIKEIRVSVEDLVDIYTGDNLTIKVEDNVISITKEVMDKFDTLARDIEIESSVRETETKALSDNLDALSTKFESHKTTTEAALSDLQQTDSILDKSINDEVERAKKSEGDLQILIDKNISDIEEVSSKVSSIILRKESNLVYALYINNEKKGEINIPKDQFLKDVTYDSETKSLVFVIETTEGEKTIKVSIADLIDTYEAGEGLLLDNNVFSVDLSKIASVEYVDEVIEKVNKELEKKSEIGHTHEISDVNNLQETLDTKLNKDDLQSILKEQIYKLFNIDIVSPSEFNDTVMNNPDDNYSVIGSGEVITMADAKTILGKTVQIKDVIFETVALKKSALNIKSPEVTISDLSMTGVWSKTVSGNTMLSIGNSQDVTIKDVTVSRSSGYNAVEVGLDAAGTTESVVIDGLNIESALSNNGINIFSFKDNAEIIIKNCHFSEVSNPIRISNATYAKNVNITIKDCTFDKWESASANYAGMILLQDYTSKSKGEIENKKPFSSFTITIDNVTGPYGKISKDTPMEDMCGSGIVDKQIIYMYGDYYKTETEGGAKKPGLIPYTTDMFPTVIVR